MHFLPRFLSLSSVRRTNLGLEVGNESVEVSGYCTGRPSCRSFPSTPPGGNVHIHYHEEKCYEDEIFFYHLGCHQWVSGHELAHQIPQGKGNRKVLRGRRCVLARGSAGKFAGSWVSPSCLEQDFCSLKDAEQGRNSTGAVSSITGKGKPAPVELSLLQNVPLPDSHLFLKPLTQLVVSSLFSPLSTRA